MPFFCHCQYAYVNHYLSVYQSFYFYMTMVQVHEFGHNYKLAHSGQGTATYLDHTGSMGNPLVFDDVGKM